MNIPNIISYLAPNFRGTGHWPLGTFFKGFSDWFSFSRCFSLLALKKLKHLVTWTSKNEDILRHLLGTKKNADIPQFPCFFHGFPYMFPDFSNIFPGKNTAGASPSGVSCQSRQGGLVAFAMSSCALSNSPRRLAAPQKL